MKFQIRKVRVGLRDPRKGFSENEAVVEYRRHPLFGFWTRINMERAKRPKQVLDEDTDWVEMTRERCPFCAERIERETPMYPKTFVPEGRLKYGDAVAFPNLFPFADHHSIIVISKEHYLSLNRFKPKHFYEGFRLALELYSKVGRGYLTLGMNYLQPAAASLVHPHMQMSIEAKPPLWTEMEKAHSEAYYRANRKSFWDEYVESEVGGERHIGTTMGFEWFASVAPIAKDEVLGVSTNGRRNLSELSDEELWGLAEGISKALKGYYNMGIRSFNLGLHVWPEPADDFSMHVHIISRPAPKELYCSDRGFLEMLFGDVVVETPPEYLAEHLRSYW